MKATRKNICDILGYHNKNLKITPMSNKNGFMVRGFLPRIAMVDLMNNFHCYLSGSNGLVCITPGRLANLRHK